MIYSIIKSAENILQFNIKILVLGVKIISTDNNKKFDFSNAVFTYMISKQSNNLFSDQIYFFSKELVINHTERTEVLLANNSCEHIAVIGLCVDSEGEIERYDIPNFLLEKSKGDLSVILNESKRFAGKYAIFYENEHGLYAFSDAVGTLQICYNKVGQICISSNDKLIAEKFNYKASKIALDIRKNSDEEQAFPFDITLYDEVKVLLPNHYLDINNNKAIRYFTVVKKASEDFSMLIEKNIRHVNNVIKQYSKYYKIVCPMSAGWDSRVIIALLKNNISDFKSFTFKHKRFSEKTADYYIPPAVCKHLGIEHISMELSDVRQSDLTAISDYIGDYHYIGTMSQAQSIKDIYPDEAIIFGDIIDQVGKSLLGNGVPDCLANRLFFKAKLHNYSKYTNKIIGEYLSGIKKDKLNNYVFDLFAIENRCGRWLAQTEMIVSTMGVTSINIFNCANILEDWISISRKDRSEKVIHKYVLKTLDQSLLEIPINPGSKTEALKENWFAFYVSTYIKYFAKKVLFSIKRLKTKK